MARSTSRKAPASRKAPPSPKAPTPPKATAVEVVPAQPTQADRDAIAYLSAQASRALPGAAYLVLVKLKDIPPRTPSSFSPRR